MPMVPMPPPAPQDRAVFMANYLLDGQHREAQPQVQNQVAAVPAFAGNVTVRLPLNGKDFRDIVFPADIPRLGFVDRVCATMGLDRTTAELGWKSNDDLKRALARTLRNEDVDEAFRVIPR